MENEREIFGGEELMKFFCKDSVESDKEYCSFIIDFENYGIYTGTYTSFEDGDSLYNDLLNPTIKWKVIYDNPFEAGCKILEFENGEQYVKFVGVEYNDVKDFFEVSKLKK